MYLKGFQDYTNAVKDFTKAIELNPHNAEAFKNRGTAYHLSGDTESAGIDFRKAY